MGIALSTYSVLSLCTHSGHYADAATRCFFNSPCHLKQDNQVKFLILYSRERASALRESEAEVSVRNVCGMGSLL